MPFTIPGGTLKVASGLATFAHIGPGAIKLAAGIAAGTSQWIHGVPVLTTDTGTVGVGSSSCPLVVPPAALSPWIAIGFAQQNLVGPMAPLTIQGVSLGLSMAFLDAMVIANHPGVVGACVIQFGFSSAIPPMIEGFRQQGMNTEGSIKTAKAIGFGLDQAFGVFSLPCPIPGAPGPSPATGKGIGFVL